MATKKTAKRKTAKKTASGKKAPPSPKSGVSLPVGNHPGNSGGKKGRSGRKPHAWKEFCAKTLEDKGTREAIEGALKDSHTPGYPALLKTIAGYAEGLPEQTVNIKGESPREQILDELARLAARKDKGSGAK